MKKYWNASLAALALGIVMGGAFLPACFEALQRVDGTSLLLGFPFPFYTVHTPLPGTYAVHLNIAALAGDILAVYFMLYGGAKLSTHFHR